MRHIQAFFSRVQRIPRRISRAVQQWIFAIPAAVPLWWRNRLLSTRVAGGGGPDVSLTTYGKRIQTVYLTIESIARGRLQAGRIVLWLDDRTLFERLPKSLERLRKRGLDVRLARNYGPHTKYYPYIDSMERFDRPLATADDDILYPRNWLADLVSAAWRAPGAVVCHRAHVVGFCGRGIAPYASWKACRTAAASLRHFATGVSGVLYPPTLLAKLKMAGLGFETCCPKADDVWLHVQAVRNGVKVAQVANRPRHFLMTLGTQGVALAPGNWNGGGNDHQIRTTYTTEDIGMLLAEETLMPPRGKGERMKALVKRIPGAGWGLAALQRLRGRFRNSGEYWERRYSRGGNSGAGSYNRLAEYKAVFLNRFVAEHAISSVIEYGCGDGAQLKLAQYPEYTGIDVSKTAVERCRALFDEDYSKRFLRMDDLKEALSADLALSLDVVYHLVEDSVFEAYMRRLFESARKFVIVYSSNVDQEWPAKHVRHREFTFWIAENLPNWHLFLMAKNPYPFDPKNQEQTSFADFYVFAPHV